MMPIMLSGAFASALITFLVFITCRGNEFVDLDDLGYIVDNHHIATLDWQTVVWAFTSYHEANWHPLTMLSLALDQKLWGEGPAGFHVTNVVIHSCTVFCVCLLFYNLFGRMWNDVEKRLRVAGSMLAALFFGLHPLRVESVVWASERKDVLCLFFVSVALCWYLRYISQALADPQRHCMRFRAYWMVLLLVALALMSKPIAVTLPLVLLILDWYPLARVTDRTSLVRAVCEKLPLLLLVCGAVILTVNAQDKAINRSLDMASRLMVACKALLFYPLKMLWPTDLAPLYPHPGKVVYTKPFEYGFYVFLATVLVFGAVYLFQQRNRLWPAVGLYYLVTLMPVLGLIQVGKQWIADRYTYLPALGLSLLWGGGGVWLMAWLRRKGRRILSVSVMFTLGLQLLAYTVITLSQIKVWGSTETLTSREIHLFPHQIGAAYYSRAKYRREQGNCEAALSDIDDALSIALRNNLREKYADISIARADIFHCLDRLPEALAATDWALQTSIGEPKSQYVALRKELAQQLQEMGSHTR